MIVLRKSSDRGHSQIDWLDSHHTFSFGDYHDLNHMGFRNIRVINEDVVQPGEGFGRHPHRNMEIISYVIEGELAHQDSLGTGSIIKSGEIQRMSAGMRVEHSEFNHSKTKPVHFLQIWILPEKDGTAPSYEQKLIPKLKNQFILIGSRHPTETAITIHQDVNLYAAYMTASHLLEYEFKQSRSGWLQLIKGKISLNGNAMVAGDGAAITDESAISVECVEDSEFLVFDLK